MAVASNDDSPRARSAGRFALWLTFAVAVLALDALTKALIVRLVPWGESLAVTPFFNIVHVGNTGSAFSMLAGAGGWQIGLFAALALIVSCIIVVLLWRYNHRTLLSLALSLVLAGAVGNMIDRVTLGFVVDFLDFHAFGLHWPAFNVADIAICCGAAGVVWDEWRRPHC
ncbi:MAG: signal peptidase II [Duodenibacillus sp.]